MIEKVLGEANRRGGLRGNLRGVVVSCRFKLVVCENTVDHSDLQRDVSAYDFTSDDQFECALLRHRTPQDRHHHRRYETDVDFRVAQLCRLSRDYEVAGRSQPAAPRKRPASNSSDDWSGVAAHLN